MSSINLHCKNAKRNFSYKGKMVSDGNLNLQDSYASRQCNGSYDLGKKCSLLYNGMAIKIDTGTLN